MSKDNPQPSDVFQQKLDLEDFFGDEIDDKDAELEKVVDLLRAESVRAFQWGREGDMQLLDGIIEHLERHEHRHLNRLGRRR